jgi:CTD small phosphatase-like protein 2
MQKNIETV